MVGLPFGGEDEPFDEFGEYVPEHLPEPGPFLDGHELLTGESHVAFHEATRDVFEERSVYDVTFDYNLARLNLDPRHPNAGYRYAEQSGEGEEAVLRAEFTPTTPFCPQSGTLTVGSFRAWNGLSDRHDYDIVRVRLHPMHNDAASINDRLAELEAEYRETGDATGAPGGNGGVAAASRADGATRPGPDAPF